MFTTTVCLQMINGDEVYFKAPEKEVHRLILQSHGQPSENRKGQHILHTEEEVPLVIDLQEIRKIHIS